MAKLPKVKCKYCGEQFYREDEQYVQLSKRYAHQRCHEEHLASQSKDDMDKEALFDYLKELFGDKCNYAITTKLLNRYINENHYTYSGIHKTLVYFYEIKKNSIDKANGSIGIVPWQYEEAKKYYMELAAIEKKNEGKKLNPFEAVARVIRIPSPQREIKKKRLFRFLDEEGED